MKINLTHLAILAITGLGACSTKPPTIWKTEELRYANPNGTSLPSLPLPQGVAPIYQEQIDNSKKAKKIKAIAEKPMSDEKVASDKSEPTASKASVGEQAIVTFDTPTPVNPSEIMPPIKGGEVILQNRSTDSQKASVVKAQPTLSAKTKANWSQSAKPIVVQPTPKKATAKTPVASPKSATAVKVKGAVK